MELSRKSPQISLWKNGGAELNEFKLLNKCLLKAKRYSDLERATEYIEYQKKLLKELGIE